MNTFFQKLIKLFLLQARFAMSGLVATSVDYGLYLFLVHRFLPPVQANFVSYSIAVVVNYLLQRRFVFQLQRPGYQAFLLSILVSIGGLGISSGIIYLLSAYPFFNDRQYITKLLATGIVFFYNFFLKRFVFEKKMFRVD